MKKTALISSMDPINIFWFRRDLRIEDNKGLHEALIAGPATLPIFIFDKNILDELPNDDPRVGFISNLLTKIQQQLQQHNKSLAVFYGRPGDIFQKLASENNIAAVYTNHDYEPYARKRDLAVYQVFKKHNIAFKAYKDQVILETDEVVKDDGTPYAVFTPYSKKWKSVCNESMVNTYRSEGYIHKITNHDYPFLTLGAIGFITSSIKIPDYNISDELIGNYQQTRNFPALCKTSLLGVHLRFGAVSIRKIVRKAIQDSNETFLNELIWREFFMQILWHFPHTAVKSFKPKYDAIRWVNNEAQFEKWCQGQTGYPFVDAGMRELNVTGHMHNRVRMVVAGFLCKHLLIDWRWGEAYFAQKLLDYEQSSNVGNWQWAAGSGVDAAPYFRIFNPEEQLKKFDKDLTYIMKWIPEFGTSAYPEPIINHKEARERCLKVYKEAIG